MKNLKKVSKNTIVALLLAVFGVGIIVIPSLFNGNGGKSADGGAEYYDSGYYTEYLEDRIRKLCLSMEGISEVSVLLTLDCSSEYVYGAVGDYLIVKKDGGEQPLVVREIYPRIRGIAVVCTGGDIPRVQERVTELLSAALGISSAKIKVAGS